MEKLRLAEKNRIISEIKTIESVLKRSQETRERFKVKMRLFLTKTKSRN